MYFIAHSSICPLSDLTFRMSRVVSLELVKRKTFQEISQQPFFYQYPVSKLNYPGSVIQRKKHALWSQRDLGLNPLVISYVTLSLLHPFRASFLIQPMVITIPTSQGCCEEWRSTSRRQPVQDLAQSKASFLSSGLHIYPDTRTLETIKKLSQHQQV